MMKRFLLDKATKLKLATFILLCGFCFSAIYYYVQNIYIGSDYPFNTYLAQAYDRYNKSCPKIVGHHYFSDLFPVLGLTASDNPYEFNTTFSSSNYFPFTHVLTKPLAVLPYTVAVPVFLIIAFLIFLAFGIQTLKVDDLFLYSTSVLSISLLCYPVQMVYDRGNLEVIVFLFAWMFIFFFQKKKYYFASFFLAVAAALKLFPAILGFLFVKEKKFKPAVASFLFFVGLTLFSFLLFRDSIPEQLRMMQEAFTQYSQGVVRTTHALQHNSSLFAGMRVLGVLIFGTGSDELVLTIIMDRIYFWLQLLTAGMVFYLVLRRKALRLWESTYLLSILTILLPPSSYDYRMIHLLIPFVLFLNEDAVTEFNIKNVSLLVLYAILLLPKNMFLIVDDVSISAILNPLIMLIIAGWIVADSRKSKRLLLQS